LHLNAVRLPNAQLGHVRQRARVAVDAPRRPFGWLGCRCWGG
jgi:hypothetical protein